MGECLPECLSLSALSWAQLRSQGTRVHSHMDFSESAACGVLSHNPRIKFIDHRWEFRGAEQSSCVAEGPRKEESIELPMAGFVKDL